MPNPALQRILTEIGQPNLIEVLAKQLSPSDLNSLLMEVMKQQAGEQSPAQLLQHYLKNRFVSPSSIDSLSFVQLENELLTLARQHGFALLELSPVAPLGSCSVIARTDQNKIVSALRGTEVVADATNVMALEAAAQRKQAGFPASPLSFGAVHRHVRAQSLPPGKGFTAHFKVFCAITAGKDMGSLRFEEEALYRHLWFYQAFLRLVGLPNFRIVLKVFGETNQQQNEADNIASRVAERLTDCNPSLQRVPWAEHRYYDRIRFSLNVIHRDQEINLGDGGLVDWTQQLTGNKKERLFTSGIGLELLLKIKNGLL